MRIPRWFQRFVVSAQKAEEKKLTTEVRSLGDMMRESRSDPLRPARTKDNGEPLGEKYAEFSDLWEQQALEAHRQLDQQLVDGTEGTVVHVGYAGAVSLLTYQRADALPKPKVNLTTMGLDTDEPDA